jgi:hypothetical protein
LQSGFAGDGDLFRHIRLSGRKGGEKNGDGKGGNQKTNTLVAICLKVI